VIALGLILCVSIPAESNMSIAFLFLYAAGVLAFPLIALKWISLHRTGSIAAGKYIRVAVSIVCAVGFLLLFLWFWLARVWFAKQLVGYALISVVVFTGILAVGWVWTRKKGALQWE
jgi:hypothetical protein